MTVQGQEKGVPVPERADLPRPCLFVLCKPTLGEGWAFLTWSIDSNVLFFLKPPSHTCPDIVLYQLLGYPNTVVKLTPKISHYCVL